MHCVSLADGALGDRRHYGKFPRLDTSRQEVKSRRIFVSIGIIGLRWLTLTLTVHVDDDFETFTLMDLREQHKAN